MKANWIAIFIGGFLGARFGPFGALVGGLLALWAYELMRDVAKNTDANGRVHSQIFGDGKKGEKYVVNFALDSQNFYTLSLFSVLGHLSKSKGLVKEEDIAYAEFVMQDLHLTPMLKSIAKKAFSIGKSPDFPYEQLLQEFYRYYGESKNSLSAFLRIQMRAALVDAVLEAEEKKILLSIASIFRFSQAEFERILDLEIAAARFDSVWKRDYTRKAKFDSMWQDKYGQRQGFERNYRQQQQNNRQQHSNNRQNSRQSHSQYQRSSRQQYSRAYSASSQLDDAFKILGIAKTEDFKIVKKAYSKQINKNHPDKLAGKNLPKEQIELANKKIKEINAAYDFICKHYSWK